MGASHLERFARKGSVASASFRGALYRSVAPTLCHFRLLWVTKIVGERSERATAGRCTRPTRSKMLRTSKLVPDLSIGKAILDQNCTFWRTEMHLALPTVPEPLLRDTAFYPVLVLRSWEESCSPEKSARPQPNTAEESYNSMGPEISWP